MQRGWQTIFILLTRRFLAIYIRCVSPVSEANNIYDMNKKEMMQKWISENPNVTIEDAWSAGYDCSTNAWCHGKVDMLVKIRELIKQIIE